MNRKSFRTAIPYLMIILTLVFTPGCLFFPKRTGVSRNGNAGIGTLQGVVRYSETGAPAAGVSVTLLKAAVVAVTDTKGHFSFPSLQSGYQTIIAGKEGYVTGAQAIYVSAGQTASVTLQLGLSGGMLHGGSSRVNDSCGSCHVLHQNARMLIGGKVNTACYTCHQTVYPRFSNQTIYEQTAHFANTGASVTPALTGKSRGDCTNCHLPHGVQNGHDNLLVSVSAAPLSSNPVCYNCHTGQGLGNTAGFPGMVAYDKTDNPHNNPNPTDPGTLLPIYPNSGAHKGECYNCHNPHGATTNGQANGPLTASMLREGGDALCVRCHKNFATRVAGGNKHTCTLCHEPHQVAKSGARYVKKPGGTGPLDLISIATKKATHRTRSAITNDYCTGCHKVGNSIAGQPLDPFRDATGFRDIRNDTFLNSNPRYRNLHAVHAKGPIGWPSAEVKVEEWRTGGPDYYGKKGPYYSYRRNCYPGGYDHNHESHATPIPNLSHNLVWCVDCHDPHPFPDAAQNTQGEKMLNTTLITKIAKSGGGYDGKVSCGMKAGSMCHEGTATNLTGNGCDWCHKDGVGNPGFSCECDSTCAGGSGSGSGSGGSGRGGSAYGPGKGSFPTAHGHGHGTAGGASTRRTVELPL